MAGNKLWKQAWVFALIVLILASIACGQSTSEQLSDAVQEATLSASGADQTAATEPENKEEAAAPEATKAIQPTKEPTPPPEDLILGEKQGFIQDGIELVAVVTVENPNSNYAIESSSYQITAYDEAGVVLGTDSGYVTIIMPGVTQAVVTSLYLEEGQVANKIEVQLDTGDAEWLDQPISVFSIDKTTYIGDENFPKITGVLHNNLAQDITEVKLTAVGYNDQDQIVGGGYTYINFVPGGGETGVVVGVSVKENPSRVELFPAISGLTDLAESAGAEDVINLVQQGFGQTRSEVGVAFMLENKDAANAVESALYRVVAYDDQGTVLSSDEGYITIVLPAEKLAWFADLYLPESSTAARVDVQIKDGDVVPVDLASGVFTVEQVNYLADPNFPKASGIVVNGLSRDVTEMRVNAVAYDDAGNMIGGGYTYVNFLPASGQTGVEVSLTSGAAPASVELYPTLSGLSIFEAADTSAPTIELVAQGYGQLRSSMGVAFLVKNTDPKNTIEGTEYQIAAYDEGGNVLDTDSGYINLIFPNQTVAGYADLFPPDGSQVARVDIQLNPGDNSTSPITENPFTTDTINFIPDTYFPKATGIITNSLDKKISDIKVIAVAYDESGNIIGGGYTYVDFVPALGQTPVEMSVTVPGTPARIELYPLVSGITSFE